jgi:hypothetical protein
LLMGNFGYLIFWPTVARCVGQFLFVAIFAGHLVSMNEPIMSSTRTFTAFPSIRAKVFFIPGCFHRTLAHTCLLLPSSSIKILMDGFQFGSTMLAPQQLNGLTVRE